MKTGLEKAELEKMSQQGESGELSVPRGSTSAPVRASLAMAAMELVLAFNMSRINVSMVKDHSMRPGTGYYTKWSRGEWIGGLLCSALIYSLNSRFATAQLNHNEYSSTFIALMMIAKYLAGGSSY